MKTVRQLLCLFLVVSIPVLADDRIGSVLRDMKVAEAIEAAVPGLKYESGDKNWSGGMFTNAIVGGLSFDSNTSYSIFGLESPSSTISAGQVASSIQKYLTSTYKLPASETGSTWSKRTPDGLDPDDFATMFIKSYNPDKEGNKGLEYITIQVSRIQDNRYAINMTYSAVR